MAEWADFGDCHPESLFTRAHNAARQPGYWHAPDSDSTECEVSELVGALVRALQPELVVETGTAFGHTTLEIAKALIANGHGCCHSLEVDAERRASAEALLHNACLVKHVDYVDVVDLRLQSSLEYEPPGPIGFAWFDSLYELRAQEFRRFYALGALLPGTIVGFHDWTSGIRGHYLDVRQEVEQLASDGLLRPIFLPTPRGVALAETL